GSRLLQGQLDLEPARSGAWLGLENFEAGQLGPLLPARVERFNRRIGIFDVRRFPVLPGGKGLSKRIPCAADSRYEFGVTPRGATRTRKTVKRKQRGGQQTHSAILGHESRSS